MATESKTIEKAKKIFTMAASVATTAMLVRTVVNEYLPYEVQDYIRSTLSHFFSRRPSDELTIAIDERQGYVTNKIYEAAEIYLGDKVCEKISRLRACKDDGESKMVITVDQGGEIFDDFEGVEFRWLLTTRQALSGTGSDNNNSSSDVRVFELTFPRTHKDTAVLRYLPFVMERSKEIMAEDKSIKLNMLRYGTWEEVTLDHPSTFDTVALDPELKQRVISDLEKFLQRKEYYRRVGKPWKRGYLLYGPPGTGKSSLIVAMANYLMFDIYDLELTNVGDNTELRSVLLATSNRSIIVVEDIDCSLKLENREASDDEGANEPSTNQTSRITLSGLLNSIDGLWSSCGDERIIVFTTNYKERLDPALLRPGRMDMHIHMSYCTPAMFRVLISNYHSVDEHEMFPEIERLMVEVEVTPAEVVGELMISDDVEEALGFLRKLLSEKKDKREREVVSKQEEEIRVRQEAAKEETKVSGEVEEKQ